MQLCDTVSAPSASLFFNSFPLLKCALLLIFTDLPVLQLALVVQEVALPAATPGLEALVAKASSGVRAGAVSVSRFICVGTETQLCLCCSLGLMSEHLQLGSP